MIVGLGDEQDGATIRGRLLAQQVHGESESIDDGRAFISGVEVAKRDSGGIGVGGEVQKQPGRTVEADHGDLMRDVADQVPDQRAEMAVAVEFAHASAAGFNRDHKRQRLIAGVLIQRELLLDAVIGDAEVIGLQREDELSIGASHQCRNNNQIGLRAQGGRPRRGCGGQLREGDRGQQESECGNQLHRHGPGCAVPGSSVIGCSVWSFSIGGQALLPNYRQL